MVYLGELLHLDKGYSELLQIIKQENYLGIELAKLLLSSHWMLLETLLVLVWCPFSLNQWYSRVWFSFWTNHNKKTKQDLFYMMMLNRVGCMEDKKMSINLEIWGTIKEKNIYLLPLVIILLVNTRVCMDIKKRNKLMTNSDLKHFVMIKKKMMKWKKYLILFKNLLMG